MFSRLITLVIALAAFTACRSDPRGNDDGLASTGKTPAPHLPPVLRPLHSPVVKTGAGGFAHLMWPVPTSTGTVGGGGGDPGTGGGGVVDPGTGGGGTGGDPGTGGGGVVDPGTGGGGTGGGGTGGGGGTTDPGAVSRPASVLSTGFFVSGGGIYDPSGHPFIARGINHTHWWGDQNSNFAAIDEFPKTGANIIRAVFGPGFGVDTPQEKHDVVARYAANHMPVIVEDHGATCGTDPAQIATIVDGWTDPANVAWLNQYEKDVILNVANEWGPQDSNVWASTYETAISRLRAAGVHNLILLDAGGSCGQYIGTVYDKWQEIEAADPEHNVAFSVHMYAFWRTPEATDVGSWGSDGTPFSIHDEMQRVKSDGIPLIVGEMGWEQDSQVSYKTKPALQIFHDLGIGYIGWSWNQNSDAMYDFRANGGGGAYTYSGPQDLTPGGQAILLDPDYGIQATSVPARGID